MTEAAKARRSWRHKNEKELMEQLNQTFFGQRARPAQVKAAAREILMRLTSYSLRVQYV
jgi:hypothetical protein